MSDLISRVVYKSKLLKALDVLNKEYREAILNEDNDLILAIQNQQSAYMIALRLLDNEPTAYSVKKVVDELEEVHEKFCKNVVCGKLCEHCEEYIMFNKNIKIVKHGGASDDVCEWTLDGVYLNSPHKPLVSCVTDENYRYYYCPVCGKKIKVVE